MLRFNCASESIGCPRLDIYNGAVEYHKNDSGQIVSAKYTCWRDYDLVGSLERHCDGEKWLGRDPICLFSETGMKPSNLLLLHFFAFKSTL